MELSKEQLLRYAIDCDMIDLALIQNEVDMNERKKYLGKHPNKIYQDKKGDWNTYLKDPEMGTRKLIRKHTKAEVEEIVVEFYKKLEDEPYVKQLFYEWANDKLQYNEITKQTYDRYVIDYNRFIKGTRLDSEKVKYVTEDILRDFVRTTIRDNNLTAKRWSGVRTILNGMFGYAKERRYTALSISNFFGDLQLSNRMFKRRIMSDEESVFTQDEVDMINEYILRNNRSSIISMGILLGFATGLRVGELVALKKSDLNDGIITVRRTEIKFTDENGDEVYDIRECTKGKEGIRNVIVTKEAVDLFNEISALSTDDEWLFHYNGHLIRARRFTEKLEKICRYIGIAPRSMHKARKTYATKLLNAGVSERLILNQMGHTDIATTKGYYYYNNKNIEEAKAVISQAMNGR